MGLCYFELVFVSWIVIFEVNIASEILSPAKIKFVDAAWCLKRMSKYFFVLIGHFEIGFCSISSRVNLFLGIFGNWTAMSEIIVEIVFSLSGMHLSGSNSKTPSTNLNIAITVIVSVVVDRLRGLNQCILRHVQKFVLPRQ